MQDFKAPGSRKQNNKTRIFRKLAADREPMRGVGRAAGAQAVQTNGGKAETKRRRSELLGCF